MASAAVNGFSSGCQWLPPSWIASAAVDRFWSGRQWLPPHNLCKGRPPYALTLKIFNRDAKILESDSQIAKITEDGRQESTFGMIFPARREVPA
jgi:hypothetical protein